MNCTIKKLTINFHSVPTISSALVSAALNARQTSPQAEADEPSYRPAIGREWHGQGGIYAGDFRGGDGTVYGLIVATEQDIGRALWAPSGERDLSDWDGLENTQRLRNDCPAAKLASEYQRDDHANFYLPARREMLLAAANLHETFGKESLYWTSTPYAADYAWSADFEHGYTTPLTRSTELRVRPFRRFIYRPIQSCYAPTT